MPEAALARLIQAYEQAEIILEYGSGGSTELAAAMPGKFIMSVESDAEWARALRQKLGQAHPPSRTIIHHVDIGPTGDWGRPIDTTLWRDYHRYPNDIWERPFFRHPDVILIDGRFRTACLATAMLRTRRPLVILFDDYVNRPKYHLVEQAIKPVAFHDRMAEFHVQPDQVRTQDMGLLIQQFFQVSLHGVNAQAYRLPDN
ncbi:hypothetical protein ACFFJ0_18645 [Sphingobium scionense]